MNANIAVTKSSAAGPDASKPKKAPRNRVAITPQTRSAVIVHRVMARLICRARQDRVSSSWLIASARAGSAVAFSSRVLARSMTRANRLVMTASIAPMPERRNTGATDNWIT